MTMTVLDRAPVTGDAGRVAGERQERPDPEVPERARRRTFTAQYKLDVLAAYDAAGPGEKGAILRRGGPLFRPRAGSRRGRVRRARSCGGRACIPVTSWTGGGPVIAGCFRGRRGPAGARRLIRGMRRSPGCARRRPIWSRSWLRPASWWVS